MDLAAACAQSRGYRHLLAAAEGAGEKKIRDIDAADQKQSRDRCKQEEQRRPIIADEGLLKGREHGRESALFIRWERCRDGVLQRIDLSVCLRRGYAGLETASAK